MTLERCLQANLAWSGLMVLAAAILASGGFTTGSVVFLATCLAFAGVALSAIRHHGWAIAISVVGAVAIAVRWTPMVLLNLWSFSQGDPRYRDSPGTILVVVIYAILFAIPGCLLSIGYALHGRRILALIRNRPNERTA